MLWLGLFWCRHQEVAEGARRGEQESVVMETGGTTEGRHSPRHQAAGSSASVKSPSSSLTGISVVSSGSQASSTTSGNTSTTAAVASVSLVTLSRLEIQEPSLSLSLSLSLCSRLRVLVWRY